jgi:L-lactate dehydrogenase complex protein LldE
MSAQPPDASPSIARSVTDGPRVALFVTCLVDLFRPSVGFAAVKLLEDAGCDVDAPLSQTCCGQPAFNGGDRATAQAIAVNVIEAFADYDYVVAPSGSCAGMIGVHYPGLFEAGTPLRARADALAAKTYELTAFLVDVLKRESIDAECRGAVAYHDSCSSLREVGVREQPRKLLAQVRGLELKELASPEACCGFGGAFCVKYTDISVAIGTRKTADIKATGAGLVLAGDLGCLLHIAGLLKREGSGIEVRHVAEVLAGDTDTPAIGEGA